MSNEGGASSRLAANDRSLIPRDEPCVPGFTNFYFLCEGMWCEPTICFRVPFIGTWVTSFDYAGTCGPRPAQGQACVDKAAITPGPLGK